MTSVVIFLFFVISLATAYLVLTPLHNLQFIPLSLIISIISFLMRCNVIPKNTFRGAPVTICIYYKLSCHRSELHYLSCEKRSYLQRLLFSISNNFFFFFNCKKQHERCGEKKIRPVTLKNEIKLRENVGKKICG